jgi:hypothetical protein
VHVQPILNELRASLAGQAALAGSDPAVQSAIAQLVEALGPALHLAATEFAAQAAAEVDAQLPEHTVYVMIADGDPALRVSDIRSRDQGRPPLRADQEDLDARITLRLTPTLKQLVEDAAQHAGESVNGWVVDALGKRTKRSPKSGRTITESFDL